jgi:hypothetical protein
MSSTERDPQTGKLKWPVGINVHFKRAGMPKFIDCANWASAADYLVSAEFRKIRGRVDFVTIQSRD